MKKFILMITILMDLILSIPSYCQVSYYVSPNPVKCTCSDPNLIGTCSFTICNNGSVTIYIHLTDFAHGAGDFGFCMGNATQWVILNPGKCYTDAAHFNDQYKVYGCTCQTPFGLKSDKLHIRYSLTDGGPRNGDIELPIQVCYQIRRWPECKQPPSCSPNNMVFLDDDIPSKYIIEQNYPNPFNAETNIEFSIPIRCFVSIKVYNMLGEEIQTLIKSELNPGNYTTLFDSKIYSSGFYF